jgi:thiol-disulfide isomerase/thioredoxin
MKSAPQSNEPKLNQPKLNGPKPNTTAVSAPPVPLLRKIGRRRLASAAAALVILLVLAGVYGIGHRPSNPADAACRSAVNTAKRLAPLARGEVAALALAQAPFHMPDLAFRDSSGRELRLGDWRGRTVLLNLWATWCVPCRREMPALDALQALLGGADFEVVAVNIDTRDQQKPLAFLRDVHIAHLAYYSDPSARVFEELKTAGKAFGMPTTVIVDPSGCEIGTMAGPAEWASDDGVKLVSAALARR